MAAPPPPPKRARQASPRVLAIAGAVVVLAGVGIGLAIGLSGGSKSTGSWPTTALPQNAWLAGASDTEHLLSGIPQHGFTLGSPSAPVTLTEYIDLQCPYCDQFETQVFPDIVRRFIKTGKIKVEMRPLAFIGPASITGRDALIAASYQNKAFNFAANLYDNQQTENTGWLTDAFILLDAESIPGMNPRQLDVARDSSAVTTAANAIDYEATVDFPNGPSTPTLYIQSASQPRTQVPLQSPTDEPTLVSSINAALRP